MGGDATRPMEDLDDPKGSKGQDRDEATARMSDGQGGILQVVRRDLSPNQLRSAEFDVRRLKARLFDACMDAEGYRLIPADAPKPKPTRAPQTPFKT